MTNGEVSDLMYKVFIMALQLGGPVLVVSMAVGIIISILQAATQIHEQTLTFVPKIIAVFVGLMIFGSWILTNLTEFVTTLWSNFSMYLG